MLSQRNSPAFVALMLVAYSAIAQTPAITGTNAPASPQFPPMGLAVSETAQVNVTNNAAPPVTGGAGPRCSGTIVFYSGTDGRTIVGPVRAFQVQEGQIFSAALPYALTGGSGSRVVFRIAITLSPLFIPTDAGPAIAPCTLASSLETYDTATGITHAFVSGAMTQNPGGVPLQVSSVVVPRL